MAILTPQEKREIKEFLTAKQKKRQKYLDERYSQAVRDAHNIIQMIIEKYSPLRIYQWGSLLDRNRFQEISDIDIAVEGLPGPQEFFSLVGDASRLTHFPVDIVEFEKIHPLHAESIREKGTLVYERRK